MNKVELELDETLSSFEVQDWIDNVFHLRFPDIKATIKKSCSGHCVKELEKEIEAMKKDSDKLQEQNRQLQSIVDRARDERLINF